MPKRNVARMAMVIVAAVGGIAAVPSAAQTPAPASGAPTTVPPGPPATPPTAAPPVAEQRGEGEPSPDASAGRTLNGHRFMPTAAVSQPFTQTSFGTFMLVGIGNTSGSITIGDQVFSGSYDYAGAGAALSYEQAFLKYFSARLNISESIYSGINGSSALVVGTTVQIGVSAGATASVPLGDTMRLGLLIDVSNTPNIGLTLGTGIASIVDSCSSSSGCNVDPSQLAGVTRLTQVAPAVSWSWAPLRFLGTTAALTYIHSSASGKTEGTNEAVALGSAVDFDMLPLWSVPIGLMAQFSWTAPFSGTGTLQHVTDLGGGIYYTGRKDLAAGVQFVVRRFAVTPGVDVSFGTKLAQIGLRYYW